MRTIVITSTNDYWEEAKRLGSYGRSTIDSRLDEVGFIHATSPNQTAAMLNRHFRDRKDIVLLLIDLNKVHPEVKFEQSLSGRPELFPHVYGALNIDAVYDMVKPSKDTAGNFVEPEELTRLSI